MFHVPTHRKNNRQPNLERLRICVIASTYPRHAGDYAVPWLRESVAHLRDRGHDITVLAPSYEGLASHSIDGIPVVRFRYWWHRWERLTHEQGAPNRIRNPWYQWQGIPYVLLGCRAARRLANQAPFDIVHAHWPFPHEPIGTAAARHSGAPLIMTAHGAEFALARRKSWVRACLRRSLLKADSLIANSSDTARQIAQLSGRAAEVIPFGSTVTPKPPSGTTARRNSPPRVLFTGRLIQRKGVEYLLRAAKLLLRTQTATIIITGDGDQRESLRKLAGELDLGHHVQFLGFVSHGDLNDQYSQCDVWVNPAIVDDRGDTEGLGVGAIEAYAHGKPVISSNVGGIPDVVIDQVTGLLVPEKDPVALAQAIAELLNDQDKARRLAAAGLRHIQQHFSWRTITDRLEQVYWRSLIHRDADEQPAATSFPSAAPSALVAPSGPITIPTGEPLPFAGSLPQETGSC